MSRMPLRRRSRVSRSFATWAVLRLIALLGTAARAAVVVAEVVNPAALASASATAGMTVGGVTVPAMAETLNYTSGTRSCDIAKCTTSASGSQLTVSLPGPVNLLIHINGQLDLLSRATPPERETCSASRPGVSTSR